MNPDRPESTRPKVSQLPKNASDVYTTGPSLNYTTDLEICVHRMLFVFVWFLQLLFCPFYFQNFETVLRETLVQTLKENTYPEICELLSIDNKTVIDFKLFAGVCALIERLLYPSYT